MYSLWRHPWSVHSCESPIRRADTGERCSHFPNNGHRPSIYDRSPGQKADHALSQPPPWQINMLLRLLSYIYFILGVIILKHWKYHVCNVMFVSSSLNRNCESNRQFEEFFLIPFCTYNKYMLNPIINIFNLFSTSM